jgi:hypothetical protein
VADNHEIELKFRIPKLLRDRVDDYRFANKFPTRKHAIVRLLEVALGATSGAHEARNQQEVLSQDEQ